MTNRTHNEQTEINTKRSTEWHNKAQRENQKTMKERTTEIKAYREKQEQTQSKECLLLLHDSSSQAIAFEASRRLFKQQSGPEAIKPVCSSVFRAWSFRPCKDRTVSWTWCLPCIDIPYCSQGSPRPLWRIWSSSTRQQRIRKDTHGTFDEGI